MQKKEQIYQMVLDLISSQTGKNCVSQDIQYACMYGSRVYGTINEQSDYDFLVVKDSLIPEEHINGFVVIDGRTEMVNITIMSSELFTQYWNNRHVKVIECLLLPDEYVYQNNFNFDLSTVSPWEIRRSFSETASNSWVKAKKKIELHKEHYVGKKSLFHSLRILKFAIQFIKYGKIDFSSSKDYYQRIFSCKTNSWVDLKEKFQKEYNKLSTELRILAPVIN